MQHSLTIGFNADSIGMVPSKVPSNPIFPVPFSTVPSNTSIVDMTKNKVNQIKKCLENDPDLKEKVSNKVAEKVIIDDIEFKYNVNGINFYEELEDFIAIQNSPATRNGYKYSIQQFVLWCDNQDINRLEIKVSDIDRYQCFLTDSQFSNKTVRTRILGGSSFYTFLLHRHPKVLKVNPFTHRKLPKDTCKNPKDYINDNDIKALRKEFQRIGRKDMVCVLDLTLKIRFSCW
jgi:hypothetical protein